MERALQSAAAIAILLLGSGCTAFGLSRTAVSFSTDPPGARVVVDRKDSGFVTPCRLSLPTNDTHRVEILMPGYAPVTLRVEHGRRSDIVLWRDMSIGPGTWRFPMWLNLEDFFEPFKVRQAYSPGNVFVRLERTGEP
ncbi:MAG: PEGA domain-containing protein [Planctomycetota bacterium]